MPVQTYNPETLSPPHGFAQVAVAEGSKLIFTAGQTPHDPSGRLIGVGDLAAQTEQAYLNVDAAITAAGGSFADVAKLTIYVVGWEPSKMPQLGAGLARAAERLGHPEQRPVTLIGVAALIEPEMLVEIEAVAVLN
jgi:enamine deaminase RidA (YjgF/YER057c/UK114 family)